MDREVGKEVERFEDVKRGTSSKRRGEGGNEERAGQAGRAQ